MIQTIENAFASANAIKADFNRIYHEPDPREYYRVLYGLDYVIPDLARSVFRDIASALRSSRGRPLKILDLGCSYGINAALLRYPIDLRRLAERYRDLDALGLEADDLITLDSAYFSAWPRISGDRLVGLDASAPAIRYARSVGLLEDGLALDLEREEPSPREARILEEVDLIISTGCVGYVGPGTFSRLLAAAGRRRPWIATFVLRMVPFSPIEETLAAAGLGTEKLEGVTFIQRRFHSAEEYRLTLEALGEAGIDTEGKESEGLLHAEFFLSRPGAEIAACPLASLVSVTRGAERPFGRRFRARGEAGVTLVR